jgi:hypothetical protein
MGSFFILELVSFFLHYYPSIKATGIMPFAVTKIHGLVAFKTNILLILNVVEKSASQGYCKFLS